MTHPVHVLITVEPIKVGTCDKECHELWALRPPREPNETEDIIAFTQNSPNVKIINPPGTEILTAQEPTIPICMN